MQINHRRMMLIFLVCASASAADFAPPRDGRLTEKQVTGVIAILKEQMNTTKGTQQAAHADEKLQAAITDHGMTREEFNWASDQLSKLWPVAMMQKKLEDRDNIAAEVKTDQEAIKPISDEIAQHDKDAADAEALAKTPPADVSADDKDAYIDQRKNDAQAAHDAAKDARDRLAEAQKSLDDANARLAMANSRIAHAQVPATDQSKDKPDPDNLALVQKHLQEYLDATGAGDALKVK